VVKPRWSGLARALTGVNLVLVAANLVGGWFLFYTVGARPDGAVAPYILWLGAVWLLGPLWAAVTVVVAVVSRRSRREIWLNATIATAYVLAWGVVLAM